jgi:hypothetical protein
MINKLEELGTALSAISDPYSFAIAAMISNQKSETLVRRLPASLQSSLRTGEATDPEVIAFASAISSLSLESFQRAVEDSELHKHILSIIRQAEKDNEFFRKKSVSRPIINSFKEWQEEYKDQHLGIEDALRTAEGANL